MSGPYDYYDKGLDVWISGYAPLPYPSLEPPEDEEAVDWDEVEGMAADRAYDKWKDEGCHEDG